MLRRAWLVLMLAAPRLGAQTELSVGLGVGSIRYSGGTSLASVTLTPASVLTGPWWSAGADATFGPLRDNGWAGQLRTDAWGAWPSAARFRPAVAIVLEGSAQTDGPATGAGHLLAEAAWLRDGASFAAGVGPSLGVISSTYPVAGVHARIRAWGRIGDALASAAVEPQRLQGTWFTDVVLGMTTPRRTVTVGGWVLARLGDSSRAAGSLAVEVRITPRLALEAGGGSYLPDLYQGFPTSGFVTLGLRAFLSRRPPARPPAPAVRRPVIATRESDGNSVRVRFAVPGATRVDIAGEWAEWQPVTLTHVAGDVWEARLNLAHGIYRFSLVVDGVRWLVPAGVATVDDGMGGSAGLLLVR